MKEGHEETTAHSLTRSTRSVVNHRDALAGQALPLQAGAVVDLFDEDVLAFSLDHDLDALTRLGVGNEEVDLPTRLGIGFVRGAVGDHDPMARR